MCEVKPTRNGMKIKGNCVDDIAKISSQLQSSSKKLNREISAILCLNSKTKRVDEVEIFKIGTSTQTSLPSIRSCPSDKRQITVHTHPVSGEAKFSETDATTIINRFNDKMDDWHCVIGDKKAQCVITTEISHG